VKALFGIGKDYNRGGYNYPGAFLDWGWGLLSRGLSGLVALLRAISKRLG